jgi:tellurite resistance protein TehA-like permease
MGRIGDWLFNSDHPLRGMFAGLAIAALNVYEALNIDNPNGFMYVLSWVCAGIGVIMSFVFLVMAISEHFSRN